MSLPVIIAASNSHPPSDILYVHYWDYTTSVKEVMDALHSLIEQGKVLYLGISDTPAWIVAEANTYATSHGKTPFCIYQGRWNVLLRDFEREIIPMARHFGMALAPYVTSPPSSCLSVRRRL